MGLYTSAEINTIKVVQCLYGDRGTLQRGRNNLIQLAVLSPGNHCANHFLFCLGSISALTSHFVVVDSTLQTDLDASLYTTLSLLNIVGK